MENPYIDEFRCLSEVAAGSRSLFLPDLPPIWYHRERLRQQYGYAVPTEEAIAAIARLGPVVEIGAGGGYWAWQLQQAGQSVVAFDNGSWHCRSERWFQVQHGGPEQAYWHSDRTLLLIWPPYDKSLAHVCLKFYQGNRVAYVGEGEGGCTGNYAFHDMLECDFDIDQTVEIPQHEGLHDRLEIHLRR